MSSVDPKSQKILTDTILRDGDLKEQQKMYMDIGDVDGTLKTYTQRSQNFSDVAELSKTMPIDLVVQAYINSHAEALAVERKLYDYKVAADVELSRIISKLNTLENEVKELKKGKNKGDEKDLNDVS